MNFNETVSLVCKQFPVWGVKTLPYMSARIKAIKDEGAPLRILTGTIYYRSRITIVGKRTPSIMGNQFPTLSVRMSID